MWVCLWSTHPVPGQKSVTWSLASSQPLPQDKRQLSLPSPSCCSGRSEQGGVCSIHIPRHRLSLPSSSSPAPLEQCVEDRQICPSLAGFQFTTWDSEAHNEVSSTFRLLRALGICPTAHGFSEMAQDKSCPVRTKTVASFLFGLEYRKYFPWHFYKDSNLGSRNGG